MLNKDAILAAQDLKTVDVDVPEWGGTVRLREMSAEGFLSFWEAVRDPAGLINPRALQSALLSRCIVDESGAQMFDDASIAALMAKSAGAVARLFEAAQKLNRLFGAAEEAAKN